MTSTLEPVAERTGEQALAENGFTGERLLKLCRRIAADEVRHKGGFLDHDRLDDLVAYLALQGVKAAKRYDPDRHHAKYGQNGGGDRFSSWLSDILSHRVTDWYRSKANGFGDVRYNNHNRVVLTAPDDDAFAIDGEDAFEGLLSERRAAGYQWAADYVGLSLPDWVFQTLDQAERVLRASASAASRS